MDTSASFGFFSTEENSTFLCSLDGGTPVACTSPAQYIGPGDRRPRVLGRGHRRGRHSRPDAGDVPVDDRPARHDGAGDDARARAGRGDAEHERRLHVHLRGRRDIRVRARRRPVRPVHVAAALHRPRRRPAHLLGARERRLGQHRESGGRPHLDGRPRGARDVARRCSGRADEQRHRTVRVLVRGGRDLPVLDRRRCAGAVRVAEGSARSARRPAHVRRARSRRGRQRGHEPGQSRLDDRARRAGDDHHRRPGLSHPLDERVVRVHVGARRRATSARSTTRRTRRAHRPPRTAASPPATTRSRSARRTRPATSTRRRRRARGRSISRLS